MEHYRNLNCNSNIKQFELGSDFIKVMFNDNAIYVYTYASAGRNNIEQMKILAKNGCGLNSYIQKYVRKKYSHKE